MIEYKLTIKSSMSLLSKMTLVITTVTGNHIPTNNGINRFHASSCLADTIAIPVASIKRLSNGQPIESST